ncbi:MAG: helix-turn-helix domain-containing protein, partial [Phycisphaeraceae bacterium]
MPRRLQQTFHCSPLEELTHQLLFAPPTKRIEQVQRTERLHDEIEADCPYPLDYLVYRITGYRRDGEGESVLLVGEAVRPDLRLIIDQLSRSVALPADDEPSETIEQVARRLSVSVKTVNRWRKAGLRWRWMVPRAGARPQIVIPRSALERFTERHTKRVRRATRFSTIPENERTALIERARRIVRDSDRRLTLNQVADRLAKQRGRALETIRLLLEKHDQANPAEAIFTDQRGPLTPREKRVIERAHRRGVPVSRLAERFERSRPSIHRVIRERRAAAARQIDLRHVHSATFERDDADAVILRAAQNKSSSNGNGE